MKIRPVGAELVDVDEANSRFSHFANAPNKMRIQEEIKCDCIYIRQIYKYQLFTQFC
jgi:hypothetical protein